MAIRFTRANGAPSRQATRSDRTGLGDGWAAALLLAVVALIVIVLAGGATAPAGGTRNANSARILAALEPAERELDQIDTAFERLCREPVLLTLELEPDCETGVLVLPDSLFDGFGGTQLRAAAEEDVAAAVSAYLEQLRRLPTIWERLEALEIRGHTDPRALRDPYTTNLVGSQQRALGVLLFLMGPKGLPEADRQDLRRLAIVSGASFSRPPASCPEASRECYADWRRVEILPVLSEARRRDDWAGTVEEIRSLVRHTPAASAPATSPATEPGESGMGPSPDSASP